jgi:hypothetical protein
MRVCPSIEGSAVPLIAHRICAEDCLRRQQENYHKCFRCMFRGKSADWQPPGPVTGNNVMTSPGARGVPTKVVEVPPPPARKRPERRRSAPRTATPAS